jgi:hydroxylamine reductase
MMFCEQCVQTASGQGCHQWGACGKSPETNAVQDLLIYCLRSLAPVALRAKDLGIATHEEDVFTCKAIFATLTNVNFDPQWFEEAIRQAIAYRETLKARIQQGAATLQDWPAITSYHPDFSRSLSDQGQAISLQFVTQSGSNVDIFSLKLTVLYGVKGVAAYAFHAQEMGQEDEQVYRFCYEALAALDRSDLALPDWVALALQVGEINLRTMELLDTGHTETYGHPTPTVVPLNARVGKAILVSGHDIHQLEALLRHCLAKPDEGIRSLPRRHRHDHQLPDATPCPLHR